MIKANHNIIPMDFMQQKKTKKNGGGRRIVILVDFLEAITLSTVGTVTMRGGGGGSIVTGPTVITIYPIFL